MPTHTDRVLETIADYMIVQRHMDASVNELCRVCVRVGLAVSKPMVAKIRRDMMRSASRAFTTPGRITTDAEGMKVVELTARAPLTPTNPDPAQLALEREAKAQRDEERRTHWKVRQAAREALWQSQRAGVGAIPPAPEATPETLPMTPETPTEALPEATDPKPKRRERGAADRALRRQYLNELLDADPGADPHALMAALRAKFGVALANEYIYDTCRVARQIHQLPRLRETSVEYTRTDTERKGLPTFTGPGGATVEVEVEPAPVAPDSEDGFAATPEEDLAWLAQQARDIMREHRLVEVSLALTEDAADVDFKVAPRTGRINVKF